MAWPVAVPGAAAGFVLNNKGTNMSETTVTVSVAVKHEQESKTTIRLSGEDVVDLLAQCCAEALVAQSRFIGGCITEIPAAALLHITDAVGLSFWGSDRPGDGLRAISVAYHDMLNAATRYTEAIKKRRDSLLQVMEKTRDDDARREFEAR